MSRIRADKFVNNAATDAPELTLGINFGASGVGGTITATGQAEFVGVVTASSFVGDGTGLTGVASTDNIITSTASTFANINSTGIISATSFEGNFILDSYLFN